MIKHIITAVLLIVFVVGGAVGADFLRPKPTIVAAHGGDAGKAEKKEKSKKDAAGKGKPDDAASSKSQYFDFSRQFVVPVMENGKLSALVIMDINLELDSSKAEGAYGMEPKMRDALTRELLKLSNEGVFSGQLTDPEKFDLMQEALLKSVRRVKEGVKSVLILDIARQDQ